MKQKTNKLTQFKQWILYIVTKRNSWKFDGANKYNCQFRISFPITGGYRETGVINVTVPANTEIEAKRKLQLFVKDKIKTTVIKIKEI